jgi:hypothetical protein
MDDVARVVRDVRRYSDAIIEFTACIKEELAAAGGDAAPVSLRQALTLRNNGAVAEHKIVTDLYVERVGPLENLRLAQFLERESRDCIAESRVLRTAVVNDGAIVLFGRDRQAYLNVLEEACQGLAREGAFIVRFQRESSGAGLQISSSSICDSDEIYPYKETGTRSVVSCDIGRFYPLSEEEALGLLPQQSSVEAPAQ